MKFPPAQPLKPLDSAGPRRAAPRPVAAGDLNPASRLVKGGVPDTQHDRLVKQTQNWVAQTFFGTLLKQMENSPFKSDLFSGGRGGQAFSSLYHQRLAEQMAGGAGAKLVHSIVRRIEAKAAYQKQQQPPRQADSIAPAPATTGRQGVNSGPRSNNGRRHVDVAAAARA
jgi:Rod binding domain-containing protein